MKRLKKARIGSRGTIVIPKEIRDECNLREGDILRIFTREGKIILVKDDVWENIHGCAKGLITADEVEKELDEDDIAWERRLRK